MLKCLYGIVLIVVMAACASAAPTPDSNVRIPPTLPPPEWRASGDVITLDNIGQIALLGRLDSPASPTTIFAHSLSPDGTRLAALDNEQLMAWDLISGALVFSTARGSANYVFYAPDKTEVYTITAQGGVTLYDANNGIPQNNFQAIDYPNDTLAFEPENGWLAFGNLPGQVKVWDPLERQSLVTFKAHDLQVTALAFSPDGTWLATAGEEGTVKVWDWRNRELLHTFTDNRPAHSLHFAPDVTQLAVSKREHIRLWSLENGQLIRTIESGEGGNPVVGFGMDGHYLVSGGTNVEISVWDTGTGGLAAKLPDVGADRTALAFSPDGTMLLTSSIMGRATLWNMTTLNERTVNNAVLDTGSLIFDVDWTSDNRLLTLFGTSGGVYIWGIPASDT